MSEMKPCRCCGIKQSPVDEKNAEYETLVSLVLQCGDEKQLLTLIDSYRHYAVQDNNLCIVV